MGRHGATIALRRSLTREKALQGLATLMMTSYCYDDCIERYTGW